MNLPNVLTKVAENAKFKAMAVNSKVAYKIGKNKPQILGTVAVIAGVGAVALAIYKTTKLEPVLDETKKELDDIHQKEAEMADPESNTVYLKADARRDKFNAYRKGFVRVFRLYWPVLALEAISIGCGMEAMKILNGRYVAASAALAVEEKARNDIRDRIVQKYGEEAADDIFNYRVERKEVEVEDKDGKPKKEVKEERIFDPINGPYCYLMDAMNCPGFWTPDAATNKMKLIFLQKSFNRMLVANRSVHMFEIKRELGMKVTGQDFEDGWILQGDGKDIETNPQIDFGFMKYLNEDSVRGQCVRDFMEGINPDVMLEFNATRNINKMIK